MPSPLERMIDANIACTTCGTKGIGNCHGWEKKPSRQELVKAEVDRVASQIIGHIDTMSPSMWGGAPKTARRSLQGGMINQIMFKRQDLAGAHGHGHGRLKSRPRCTPPTSLAEGGIATNTWATPDRMHRRRALEVGER
jgi:hypothetical protein